MSGYLRDDQLNRYRRNGYVYPLEIVNADEADEHNRQLLAAEAEHGPMHYRTKPYLLLESAYKIATHPRLLDAVQSVLGPDILLWDGSYVIKEAHSAGFISWHQDLTYWGLESESDDDLVTAWVALTPARRENGCMQFVDGSHCEGRFQHDDTFGDDNLLHRGQTIHHDFSAQRISHLQMTPGLASLHHGWAVHSSTPNTSDIRRTALSLQYIRPCVRQTVVAGESATLVRGLDRYQHFGAEPAFQGSFHPQQVTFQAEVERLKKEVYDNA